MTEKALNLLFKTERSKVYLEDLQAVDSPIDEAAIENRRFDESDQSELENQEALIYEEMH